MKRGAHFADSLDYKLSIEYWNYALNLTLNYKIDEKQNDINQNLSPIILINEYDFYLNESIFIINSLISLYFEIYCKLSDNDENNNNQIVTFDHLFTLYKAVETQILYLIDYVNDTPINFQTCRSYHQLLSSFLNCINLIFNFDFKDKQLEKQKIFEHIGKFIRTNSKNLNKSLLVSQTNITDLASKLDIIAKYMFPNLNLIKFLLNLNCGYHLNMKNEVEETPLFVLMKKYTKSVNFYALLSMVDEALKIKLTKFEFDLTQDIINYMLNNGAHIDIYDTHSNLLSNLFLENEFYINQLKYIKLACLCANVIKKHKIKYNLNDLPVELCQFIEIH